MQHGSIHDDGLWTTAVVFPFEQDARLLAGIAHSPSPGSVPPRPTSLHRPGPVRLRVLDYGEAAFSIRTNASHWYITDDTPVTSGA